MEELCEPKSFSYGLEKIHPLTCENCGKSFKTESLLVRHRQGSKFCKRYRGIMFTCKRCKFEADGMYVLDAHVIECNKNPVPANLPIDSSLKIAILEDEKRAYQTKATSLEAKLHKHMTLITKLRFDLKLERMKNRIFSEIITHHTPIKLSDVIQEKEDGLHVFNPKDMRLPVIVHDFTGKSAGVLTVSKSKLPVRDSSESVKAAREAAGLLGTSKKPKYKVVNHAPESVVDDEALDRKIEETDREILTIKETHFADVTPFTIHDQLESLFTSINQTRVYAKYLTQIKGLMHKFLGQTSLEEYIKVLEANVGRLTTLFNEKNFDLKKLTENVRKSLSSIDVRLIRYSGYSTVSLDIDDMETFKIALELNPSFQKKLVPFNFRYPEMFNHSIAIYPLKFCIERLLINKYGFHNVIYATLPKSLDTDPFSFYTLEKIEEGKKFWKMDCRLEDFATKLSTTVTDYCVTLFRNLYRDIFRDNEYRTNYMTFAHTAQNDCDQLLKNIAVASSIQKCCELLRSIVKEKASYTPTKSDKFNLTSDDILQKRRFKNVDWDEHPESIMFRLFDGISSDDAISLYSRY